jgi:hypothetical protein
MMRNVTVTLFLLSSVLLGNAHAAENERTARNVAASSDESPAKTIVYIARNSPATELRPAIAEFLQDTDSRVVSDAISNVLLIQTTAENQERVLAVLQQLDRAPRTFRIQLHLLEARGESLAEVDAASLTGQTDEVLKSIKALESTSSVYAANRIELTAIESQPTFLQVGEDVPLRSSTTSVPGRGSSSSYRSVAVGTMFKVQARLSGESDIVLEVDFEKSKIEPPSGGADEESKPVPRGVSRLTHQTTSRIRDGHSLLVGTLVSQSPDGVGEAYLVLSASIVTPEHPKRMTTLQPSSRKPGSKADSGQANLGSDAESLDQRYRTYAARLLARYDQNNDKALDAEEQSSMSKSCSAADTDRNGLVTLAELTIWIMKR